MSLLTIEGFAVQVIPGTRLGYVEHGDKGRAFSGKMRSDIRARHRAGHITGSYFSTDNDAPALVAILNSPGPITFGGTLVGDDAYFHVTNVETVPVTVDHLQVSFDYAETDEAPSPLLFSFDGDAPGALAYTRASIATYADAEGVLQGAGGNRLRLHYLWVDVAHTEGPDEVSLLVEPARTNKLVRSEALDNASWTKAAASIDDNASVGPDGAASMDKIIEDGTNANHGVSQAVTGMAADAVYALSGWFIAGARSWVRLNIFETAASTNIVRAWFNLSTGVIGTTSAGGTGAVVRAYVEDWTHVTAGLYRCVLAGSVGNGATAISASVNIATADTVTSYAGDGASDVHGGYLQLEEGASASSYIATSSAADTRQAGAGYGAYTHAPQAMTVYVKMQEAGGLPLTSGCVFHIGDANVTTDPRLVIDSTGSFFRLTHDNGTTARTATLAAAPARDQLVELRAVLNADGSILLGQSLDEGAESVTATSSTAPLGSAWANTRLYIGSGGSSNQGLNPIIELCVVAGVRTIVEMRDWARARLHPRISTDVIAPLSVSRSASVGATSSVSVSLTVA